MDEVDVQPVDLGDEVRQAVQLGLAPAPVVVRRPVASELLHGRERHALRVVVDGLSLPPPGRADAPAQLGELRRGEADVELADGVTGADGLRCGHLLSPDVVSPPMVASRRRARARGLPGRGPGATTSRHPRWVAGTAKRQRPSSDQPRRCPSVCERSTRVCRLRLPAPSITVMRTVRRTLARRIASRVRWLSATVSVERPGPPDTTAPFRPDGRPANVTAAGAAPAPLSGAPNPP